MKDLIKEIEKALEGDNAKEYRGLLNRVVERLKDTPQANDDIDERVETTQQEVKDDFIEYLEDKQNEKPKEFDEYYQAKGCERVSEIADSNAPIYNKDIDDIYYMNGDELEEAYKNAGIGEGGENNHKQVAILMYLEQKGFDMQREIEEKYNEIKNQKVVDIIKEIKEVDAISTPF